MPYTTVMKKIKGQPWLDDHHVGATSAAVLDQAEQEITALLRDAITSGRAPTTTSICGIRPRSPRP